MFDPYICRDDFSAFCEAVEIRRTGPIAEIIVDMYRPEVCGGRHASDAGKPVRLIGFEADASESDFAILEAGHRYLVDFMMVLGCGIRRPSS